MKNKLNRLMRLSALFFAVLLALTGCSGNQQSAVQMQIPPRADAPVSNAAPAQSYQSSQASVLPSNSGVMQDADLTIAYVAAAGTDLHPPYLVPHSSRVLSSRGMMW